MTNKKNIAAIFSLSLLISFLFILLSALFVHLSNYNPIDKHILLNVLVWGIELIIAYFIVMITSHIIFKKIKIFNKWIIYISLIVTVITISLMPDGFDSLYVNTVLGVISVVELTIMAFKQGDISLSKEKKNKENDEE